MIVSVRRSEQVIKLVQQLAEAVPGDDDLAVRLRYPRPHGPETAVADDDLGMVLAEVLEPDHLVGLLRRDTCRYLRK